MAVTNLSEVMGIFSDILSKRTKDDQKAGLDAQVKARPKWASESIDNPLKVVPVSRDDPRKNPDGTSYGKRRDPKGLRSPEKGRHLANPDVPAKHVTPEAVDKHQKREAMRVERMLESGHQNPHHRMIPPKNILRRRAEDKAWKQYLRDTPDHPDHPDNDPPFHLPPSMMGYNPKTTTRDRRGRVAGVPKSEYKGTPQHRIADAVKRMKESGELDQKMEKSRFEQQPIKGNFIPRPDPKKNTTSDNDDDTSVILAKESPRPVPGTYSSRKKESVGRGKKAGGSFESDAAVPDNSTHVIGMEKADDAREAAKYQTRGKRKPSVMERRKPVISQPKDPDAPKQGQWKSGKWVQELSKLLKISSSTPDKDDPDYLRGWVDRKRAERIREADLDPRGHSTGGDATEKEKQVNRYNMWRGLANETGELKGDPYPQALQDPRPPSVTNMNKLLKAFGVIKARSAANRAKNKRALGMRRAKAEGRKLDSIWGRVQNVQDKLPFEDSMRHMVHPKTGNAVSKPVSTAQSIADKNVQRKRQGKPPIKNPYGDNLEHATQVFANPENPGDWTPAQQRMMTDAEKGQQRSIASLGEQKLKTNKDSQSKLGAIKRRAAKQGE